MKLIFAVSDVLWWALHIVIKQKVFFTFILQILYTILGYFY